MELMWSPLRLWAGSSVSSSSFIPQDGERMYCEISLTWALHSKIKISDVVGDFSKNSMVKIRGQISNGNTVKQTAENGQKISGDDGGRYYVAGARRQEFEAAEWSWIRPNIIGLRMAGRIRTDSGWSWTFQIARLTLHEGGVAQLTSQALASAFFSPSVWPSSRLNFDLGPSPSDSTGKKSIRSGRAYDFGVQFSKGTRFCRMCIITQIHGFDSWWKSHKTKRNGKMQRVSQKQTGPLWQLHPWTNLDHEHVCW